MKKHTCCHPGCGVEVEKHQLACLDHWHQVPKIERAQVQIRVHGWKNRSAAHEYLVGVFRRQMRMTRNVA